MNFSALTDFFDSLNEKYNVPMADIKVMQSHKELYRRSFGCADYAGKVPLNNRHMFRLYSTSKVITATAMLKLIEDGKLNLNDPLGQYIPAFDFAKVLNECDPVAFGNTVDYSAPVHEIKNKIKIVDLVTMTAGLSYDTEDKNLLDYAKASGLKATTLEMVEKMAEMPLLYEPGTRWIYSLGHDVLAAVIEIASGQRFSDYLQENFFDPIGMKDIMFHWEKVPEADARVCDLYRSPDGSNEVYPYDDPGADTYCFTDNYESGGAGLAGSVDSYSQFADMLACSGVAANGTRILKPETVKMFTTPYTTSGKLKDDFDRLNKRGYDYGYGVRVMTDNSYAKSPIGEFGWDGAAGAFVLVDLERELSIFYAEHIMNSQVVYDVIHPTLRDLVYEGLES